MSAFRMHLPRIRAILKWSMVLLTVMLVVLWLGSGWFVVLYEHGNRTWQAYNGCFLYGETTTPGNGWRFHHPSGADYHLQWQYYYFRVTSSPPGLYMPIWIAALLPGIISVLALLRDWKRYRVARRERWLRSCRKCGFSFEGLAAGAVCPECGRARTSAG